MSQEESSTINLHGFCAGCAEPIKAKGAICLKCGLPSAKEKEQPQMVINNSMQQQQQQQQEQQTSGPSKLTGTKSKGTAIALAFILGGLGAHKFYLGQPVQGILYLLFCWTFVPTCIALVETVCYLTYTEEKFQRRFG